MDKTAILLLKLVPEKRVMNRITARTPFVTINIYSFRNIFLNTFSFSPESRLRLCTKCCLLRVRDVRILQCSSRRVRKLTYVIHGRKHTTNLLEITRKHTLIAAVSLTFESLALYNVPRVG